MLHLSIKVYTRKEIVMSAFVLTALLYGSLKENSSSSNENKLCIHGGAL